MDLGGGNALAGLDLTKLSDRDKQELQQFVVNESQKARIQSCTSFHLAYIARFFLPTLALLFV
jgi:hypothetical protein